MDPITMAMLPALLKGGTGLIQAVSGGVGMLGTRRPRYRIPGAAVEALGTARELAGRMEMPGESAARARIAQQAANAYGQSQQYGMAGLASLPAIMAGQQGAELNLAAQAAGWRTQQQQNLMSQLGQFAQYQDQAWQMNEFAPYRDRLQRMQNLIGAGAQNIASGADTAMMTMIGMPDLFGNNTAGQMQNLRVNYTPGGGTFSMPYLNFGRPR